MSSPHYGLQQPILIQRPRGDRPHLLPFNRRLRHLCGVSFRNLAFAELSSRARTKTIDDDAIPYTLSSPAKLLALNETHELAHSRSSDDLTATGRANTAAKHAVNGHAKTPMRRPQRRNTAEWLSASPKQRRRKVQDAIIRHTGDVFFSLHSSSGGEPLYVSETVENVMNHDFRFFDLAAYGMETTSQSECRIIFWARHRSDTVWIQLRVMSVPLHSLTYVGRSLDAFHHHVPENFAFFHLSDGIYASESVIVSSDDLETPPLSFESAPKPSKDAEPTSSYDALMRLSTLDACIQDALVTQAKLTAEISELVAENNNRYSQPTHLALARDQLSSVEHANFTTRKQISTIQASIARSRKALATRREMMASGREAPSKSPNSSLPGTLAERKSQHNNIVTQVHGQRRRLCTDFQLIYPVEPSPDHSSPLAFTIRHLYLPNSGFTSEDLSANAVAAALGHTAHCVHHLSLYLSVLLPYPITPRASISTITDPISLLAPSQSRTFPLYVTARSDNIANASGSAAFGRFEYGVFLLNKDIEALASKLEVRVMDIRQTLPNLKYIFLVATAGKGEVPRRLAGGVRGLIGRGLGSAESSRRGSEDSGAGGEAGKAAEEVRRRLRGAGSPRGRMGKGRVLE